MFQETVDDARIELLAGGGANLLRRLRQSAQTVVDRLRLLALALSRFGRAEKTFAILPFTIKSRKPAARRRNTARSTMPGALNGARSRLPPGIRTLPAILQDG